MCSSNPRQQDVIRCAFNGAAIQSSLGYIHKEGCSSVTLYSNKELLRRGQAGDERR